MSRKALTADFDENTPIVTIKASILHRLSTGGPGHTLYCLSRHGAAPCPGACGFAPLSWRPGPAVSRAVRELDEAGALTRLGAYWWLRAEALVG